MIEVVDAKGTYWELIPGWYDTSRKGLVELWCTVSWGTGSRDEHDPTMKYLRGYTRIPVPVFTELFQ